MMPSANAMSCTDWVLPIGFGASTDTLLQQAHRSYTDHLGAAQALSAGKLELVRPYDVPNMDRAATICHCGGSGSLLLASYFDSHPDVVMLPMLTSTSIYPFLRDYASLSIWEKLIAYPGYSQSKQLSDGNFFLKENPTGSFAVDEADYFAAVHALYEVHGNGAAEWLNARPTFFRLLHIAYTAAVGRRLENPRPLMLYAQHWFSQQNAEHFILDFPGAKFIHTIRDPISGLDSWFDRKLDMEMWREEYRPERAGHYFDPAVATNIDLLALGWDRGHAGMEERSRAVRFEDMHLATEAMMHRLADWLGIAFSAVLVRSTWNGTPYVVKVRGTAWCGANPANAKRRWKNMTFADRLLIFSLMHKNFVLWGYPIPGLLHRKWMRLVIVATFWLVPTKMEVANASFVLRRQALPNLHRGKFRFALGAPLFLLHRRLRMMSLIAAQARARLMDKAPVVRPI